MPDEEDIQAANPDSVRRPRPIRKKSKAAQVSAWSGSIALVMGVLGIVPYGVPLPVWLNYSCCPLNWVGALLGVFAFLAGVEGGAFSRELRRPAADETEPAFVGVVTGSLAVVALVVSFNLAIASLHPH